MENGSINSESRVEGKLTSKNVQIRLLGHCIICLRKVSLNRKGNCGTSEYGRGDGDGFSTPPVIAPKSVVITPGFLSTFNQIWAVLQTKWKEKNNKNKDGNDGSSDQIGIRLENVLENGCGSTNVRFSRAPTICEGCSDKVLAVENLIKAVRQQVREISMLLEQGRRRQLGEPCDFEKSLRAKRLEESVIRATLQFVGIFELEPIRSQDNFKELIGYKGSEEASNNVAETVDLECDEDSSLEGHTGESGDDNDECDSDNVLEEELKEDDEDPDYIKSEQEEDDDEEDESEEEMEVDEEEDKNDPDFKVETDPLAVIPPNKRKKYNSPCPANPGDNEDSSKFPCSCGKTFTTFPKLRDHMRKNLRKHPEYVPFSFKQSKRVDNEFPCTCEKSFKSLKNLRDHMNRKKELHPGYKNYCRLMGQRQLCELCGEWVMFSDILGHFTETHLNGQAEWVIRCPNDKCRFLHVSLTEFQNHLNKQQCKECKKIWKETRGNVCDTCGFQGTNVLKIRNHLKDKHENGKEKKWTCPISECGKMFCVKQSVHLHMHEHRHRPPITEQICDKCGETLKVEEMEGHLRDKHGIEEVIGCGQCPCKFSGREEMVEHLFEHRDVGILCDICGDGQGKIGRYSDFREHYFAVHKLCPKKYKCEEGDCDNWFWRNVDKEQHELRLHKESNLSIRYRNTRVAEKGKKEFECDECNVKFVKEDILRNHKIRLHGADPYTCDICGETFHVKHSLNRHKREHAGIVWQNEWKCEMEGCGKIFKQKRRWKHHVEVGHGGVKPHVCEICGKGYTVASGLRTHRDIVHLGLRPWVCDECGERFVSSTVLKTHKLIHSGERPFGCEICGQRFRHRDVLTRHLAGHQEKGAEFKPNGPMKQIRKRKAQ